MNFLHLRGVPGRSWFAHQLDNLNHNGSLIAQIAHDTMCYLSSDGKHGQFNAHPLIRDLEKRWYASLQTAEPDYSVYAEDVYLAEVWCCWEFYARKYLQEIFSTKFVPQSLQRIMGEGHILDVGNGLGLTSAVFSQLFPFRKVFATNLKNTAQWAFNEYLLRRYQCSYTLLEEDFSLLQNLGPIALLFASEYFEHFQNPGEHLDRILSLKPRVLVTANAFGADAIGHFNQYKWKTQTLEKKETSRYFGRALRDAGYTTLKTKLWNNRPAIHVRS